MISHSRRLLSLTTAIVLATTAIATAAPSEELIAAAKKEGMLTTIALPHDWCGYGDVIASFKAKYPEIQVNELNPDAGSADEIEAIKANKDNKGPQAPDVIDVVWPSVRRQRRKAFCSLTRSPPGTKFQTTSRMPKATGTATITASCPSS